MNKSELIDATASRSGLTKKDTKLALEVIIEVIETTVANGLDVTLVGFGTFSARAREARTATIPGTTTIVEVPATTVPKFKAGSNFKTKVAAK